MIKLIKNSLNKFNPARAITACSHRNQLGPITTLPYLQFDGNIQQSLSSRIIPRLSNRQMYGFATKQNKTQTYEKTGQQLKSEKPDNSSDAHKIITSPKLINRLRQYSAFLAKKQKSSSSSPQQQTFLSTNNMQLQMVNQIDKNLIQAGTNVQEISQSLAQIANKLQAMLKQSQMLLQKNKKQNNIKQFEKYSLRYKQFINLLNKLNNEYYPQPKITKIEPIEAALFILDLQTQLNSVIQLLYGSIQQNNPYFKYTPDIASDEPFSKNFQYAWNKVKIIQLDAITKNRHDMVYKLLRKSVIMVTNAVVTEHTMFQWDNQYWHKILFGLSFPVSLINLQKAQLRCYKLWRRPNIKMVKNLLDLPEKGYIQHAKKVIYPFIKSNFFLYNHTAPKSTAQNKESVHGSQVQGKQTNTNIFQQTQNSGRILLLAHQNLSFKGENKPVQKYSGIKKIFNFNIFKKQNTIDPTKQMETVIIHMHGGGFIAMSSQLMQNHTRVWANQLHVPVFSLDYRKPPEHRFPQPLQDCVAGYKFIVEKIHNYLNIKPKNIILAGDSAGGNMACALQAQLMKEKYPVLPKALFLMYPATDLRIRYTPSRLNSLSDGIFLPSLLMLCQEEYLGKDRKNQFDPLASPILLTEAYINPQKKGTPESQKWPQAWPKTVIFAGRKDPLFDDSIRLLQRLTRDGIDCKMRLYKDFSHGFMSMDQVLPGAKQALKDSTEQIRQLIKSF